MRRLVAIVMLSGWVASGQATDALVVLGDTTTKSYVSGGGNLMIAQWGTAATSVPPSWVTDTNVYKWVYDKATTNQPNLADNSGTDIQAINNGPTLTWSYTNSLGGSNDIYYFDGNNDYYSLGNPSRIQWQIGTDEAPFTVGCFLWPALVDSSSDFFMSKYDGDVTLKYSWALALRDTGRLAMYIYDDDGSRLARQSDQNVLNTNGWIMVCGTYSGTGRVVHVYTNGIACDTTDFNSGTFDGVITNQSATLFGARYVNPMDLFYKGYMDFPFFTTSVMSQAAMTNIMIKFWPTNNLRSPTP